jgi:putative phosphoribosyl transferase
MSHTSTVPVLRGCGQGDRFMKPFGIFSDRAQAGRQLAARLAEVALRDPVVMALPRGGVPVAFEVAQALEAPLDLLVVRKIGVPGYPELALAAVVDGERADLVINDEVVAATGFGPEAIKTLAAEQLEEIERRRRVYLYGRAPVAVAGRSVIVVDDGIATGASMRAALTALGRRGPKEVVLAVPVAPVETIAALRPLVDHVVCLATPDPFGSIGAFYDDFHQLSDAEVTRLLAAAAAFGRATGVDRSEVRLP